MRKLLKFAKDNALLTVIFAMWTMAVTTWTIYRVFTSPTISSETVAALGIVAALPTLAVGFIKWRSGSSVDAESQCKDEQGAE